MTLPTPTLRTPETLPDWPVYWFAKLELAVRVGDFAAALDATRELRTPRCHVVFAHPTAPTATTPTPAKRTRKAVRT